MSAPRKIAFAMYDGFSLLDFAALYDPLTSAGEVVDLCAVTSDVYDDRGLHVYATRITRSLSGYQVVVIPGSPSAAERFAQPNLCEWIASANGAEIIAANGSGVILAAAAGLAKGRQVAANEVLSGKVAAFGALPVNQALVVDLPLASAATTAAALELGQSLVEVLQDMSTAPAGIPVTGAGPQAGRSATLVRQTGETQVEVRVDIDGSGRHQVDTGLPFLDHMLAQVAVHGLFDLYIQAKGDLQIDPHHTMEDVALALGSTFQQALGDRAGIVRMASADCPMDESLAWVAVDFSGRPYSVIKVDWHGPSVGGLPVSLFQHFFESFALNARCNLHAAVRYGRDDHHQAEAMFKALGRAMSAATRIDPRRAGQVPSSKGILF